MHGRILILIALGLALSARGLSGGAESSQSQTRSENRSATHTENGGTKQWSAAERGERRGLMRRAEPEEMETVAFLGVETGPVAAAVSAQLGLPRGTGLVVNHVVPKSPAVGVLQQHDILLKLDDQILIETRQLAVLIRNKQPGDEVTLTYLRGGKQATAKVKLGQHEAPKLSFDYAPEAAFGFGTGPERFGWFQQGQEGTREEADRLLSLLRRGPGAPDGTPGFVPRAPQVRIERVPGPGGVRAMSLNTRNSNLVYSDDEGSLELRLRDGEKTLLAKNAQGAEVFAGPVSTPKEREALPAELRGRLERLEHMNGLTFDTDADFRSGTRVLRPRGITMPLPGPAPVAAPLRRPAPASF